MSSSSLFSAGDEEEEEVEEEEGEVVAESAVLEGERSGTTVRAGERGDEANNTEK